MLQGESSPIELPTENGDPAIKGGVSPVPPRQPPSGPTPEPPPSPPPSKDNSASSQNN